MPIVVNELVIKATITDAAGDPKTSPEPGRRPPVDPKALVEACVEEVLKILEQRKER